MSKRIMGSLLLCALLICLAATTSAADADTADATESHYQKSMEIGCAFSSYTGNLGRGNGQFLRCRLWRPQSHTWAFDVGRDSRFEESSFGYGVSYTRHLPNTLDLTIAANSGTGEFLAPEYRIFLGIQRAFLPMKNMILSAGYTRDQSKAENSYDGWGMGALYYAGPHLLFGVNAQYNIGHPGDTTSSVYNFGATWYRYKDIYLGCGYNTGNVSYMLVGPTNALVDYESEGWYIAVSKWLTDHSGLNARFDHGSTSFYKIDGCVISYFREF